MQASYRDNAQEIIQVLSSIVPINLQARAAIRTINRKQLPQAHICKLYPNVRIKQSEAEEMHSLLYDTAHEIVADTDEEQLIAVVQPTETSKQIAYILNQGSEAAVAILESETKMSQEEAQNTLDKLSIFLQQQIELIKTL